MCSRGTVPQVASDVFSSKSICQKPLASLQYRQAILSCINAAVMALL